MKEFCFVFALENLGIGLCFVKSDHQVPKKLCQLVNYYNRCWESTSKIILYADCVKVCPANTCEQMSS